MEDLRCIFSAGTSIFEAAHVSNDLNSLRATLPKAFMLLFRGERGMLENKQLEKLLSHLKDAINNAEALLREVDDQALRKKIEDADRKRVGQILSSSLNIAKSLISCTKSRINHTKDNLIMVVNEVEGALKIIGPMSVEPSSHMSGTTSILKILEVRGRNDERDDLINKLGVNSCRGSAQSNGKRAATSDGVASTSRAKQPRGESGTARLAETASTSRAKQPRGESGTARLAETHCTNNISVISIVGIGGVGKTTLAQFIYNDARVKQHFGVTIWVCVSGFFNKERITKEIIQSIAPIPNMQFEPSCSLNALQIELIERIKICPRFLLVLDDIWPNANADWEDFVAPLSYGREGSMVLVTTRYPKVANHVTTSNCEPKELQGLPSDIFWDFFSKCAFGTNDPESYPCLKVIGQGISKRLFGSPLGAKTLGRMLRTNLTEQHWMAVHNSELWDLRYEGNEILPALQQSYLNLPDEMKRCFTFCSMFPKNHSFERGELVDIWIAEGYVPLSESMCPEDVGNTYVDELRNRLLFQTDPTFPNTRYVISELIYDMAASFSKDECFVMQNHNKSRMQNTVRHMSIEVEGESLITVPDIQPLNKLHSLRFGVELDVEITWFSQLSNIVYLNLRGCKLVKLPESICELSSLRYLDISHSSVQELPWKIWCLYSLQVLDASHSNLKTINQAVTKLINLRRLALPAEACRGLGNLPCLQRVE